MDLGDVLVPWTSFGPWLSHIKSPGAPSWPEVAILDDMWGQFWVTLELILGTGGVFFDVCRLQELKRRARAGAPNQNRFFINFWICPRRSGGFSLQRELCFHFGGQWQIMSTLSSILESFWEPKAQLYSFWGLLEAASCCTEAGYG